MIDAFVKKWEENKGALRDKYINEYPSSYDDIVKDVVALVSDEDDFELHLNPDNIHIIDDGDYQGTRLYVIPVNSYQPYIYYSIFVNYGSCGGCDAFESLMDESRVDIINKSQTVDGLMSLALHMVQSLKQM